MGHDISVYVHLQFISRTASRILEIQKCIVSEIVFKTFIIARLRSANKAEGA